MCGRYLLNRNPRELTVLFPGLRIADIPDEVLRPRFNIAPTQLAPVITSDVIGDGASLHLTGLPWGFPGTRPMINARSETVFEKPTFRQAARTWRCLVPASGWYEWQRSGGNAQPWVFRFADDAVVNFAGIYQPTFDGDVARAGFAVLTTRAADAIADVHDRMPVIVPADAQADWLRDGESALPALTAATREHPLDSHQVSDRVNRVAEDDPACAEPGSVPTQDDLFG